MMVLSYAPEDTTRVEKFYRAFEEAGLMTQSGRRGLIAKAVSKR